MGRLDDPKLVHEKKDSDANFFHRLELQATFV